MCSQCVACGSPGALLSANEKRHMQHVHNNQWADSTLHAVHAWFSSTIQNAMHVQPWILLHPGVQAVTKYKPSFKSALCPADLPSQMSSSTWPDSPRQLAEQSLTPLEVSPLPSPHSKPFTNTPDGFSSAPHDFGLQPQSPQLTPVGSLAGQLQTLNSRLTLDSHSLPSDPHVLGSDLELLGLGPLGVVSNPDTLSLKVQGAASGHQHAQPALSGTKSRQSLSLGKASPKVPQLQSPFWGFAQTDSLPLVSSQGPCSTSFSSAYVAVPRHSSFDTRARPAAQRSPFADVPVLKTPKASSGSVSSTEPHESSHHAGNSLVQKMTGK